MYIISYDISDDLLRARFSKMLSQNGAIRLQYSVYEVNNSKRVLDNLIVKIDSLFAKHFGGGDSVLLFDVPSSSVRKYGNALHRDVDVVYL